MSKKNISEAFEKKKKRYEDAERTRASHALKEALANLRALTNEEIVEEMSASTESAHIRVADAGGVNHLLFSELTLHSKDFRRVQKEYKQRGMELCGISVHDELGWGSQVKALIKIDKRSSNSGCYVATAICFIIIIALATCAS